MTSQPSPTAQDLLPRPAQPSKTVNARRTGPNLLKLEAERQRREKRSNWGGFAMQRAHSHVGLLFLGLLSTALALGGCSGVNAAAPGAVAGSPVQSLGDA